MWNKDPAGLLQQIDHTSIELKQIPSIVLNLHDMELNEDKTEDIKAPS
jgi:hypothetical protein